MNNVLSVEKLNETLGFLYTKRGKTKDFFRTKEGNQIYFDRVDIVFVAGLMLDYETNRNNNWEKSGIIYSLSNKNKGFEIRQYFQQYKELYDVDWTNVFNEFSYALKEESEKPDTFSASFAPMLYINIDTLNPFFTSQKAESGVLYFTSQQEQKIIDMKKKYIDNFKKKKETGNQKEKKYFSQDNSIIKELEQSSPIQTFVFSILYAKISPFVKKSQEKEISNPSERIEELWEFTKEYVRGLHELAKNIVEHSTTGKGMITIRVYDGKEEKAAGDKLFETYVFDYGAKGIVPTLIEETGKQKSNNKIAEDLDVLSKKITLSNFIRPTVQTKLNQQLYREIAHYGLMKFYKLIEEKNGGNVISSSIGKNGNREYYPENCPKGKSITLGTSYFFQLPFNHSLFSRTADENNKSNIEPTYYGTQETINSLSVLMKFEVVEYNADSPTINQGKTLVIYNLNNLGINKIKNRSDEVNLFRLFSILRKDEGGTNYIAINMNNILLSASSLLRFFAHLSNNYSNPFIVYNLNYELYEEMIEDNKQFYTTLNELDKQLPYWYNEKGILIFPKLSDKVFNFADILYGSDEPEFFSINHTISLTFPNTISIINGKNDKEFDIPQCLERFFYKSALLPFDLFLCNEKEKTLFQSNLEILVSQELKAN
jgi:hypothetical protein